MKVLALVGGGVLFLVGFNLFIFSFWFADRQAAGSVSFSDLLVILNSLAGGVVLAWLGGWVAYRTVERKWSWQRPRSD